jgi:hypothetical protein
MHPRTSIAARGLVKTAQGYEYCSGDIIAPALQASSTEQFAQENLVSSTNLRLSSLRHNCTESIGTGPELGQRRRVGEYDRAKLSIAEIMLLAGDPGRLGPGSAFISYSAK